MPLSDFQCNKCQHQWEEFYNAYNPKPEICPECSEKTVIQLISLCHAKGHVELTGHELNTKIREDVQHMKKRATQDHNYLANIVGESKFNKQVK